MKRPFPYWPDHSEELHAVKYWRSLARRWEAMAKLMLLAGFAIGVICTVIAFAMFGQ
jgi:hypothetical protein